MCMDLFKKLFGGSSDNEQNNTVTEAQTQEPESGETVLTSVTPEVVYNPEMVMLLDNGHASTTPGKRSPVWEDGYQFFEYEFNRDIVSRISKELDKLGIKYHIITPEVDKDIKLSERAKRVNAYCNEYGKNNCFLISVHANASGNGDWMKARGWSAFTTKGKTKSDEYATILYGEAERLLPRFNMSVRKDMSDGDPD